MSQRRSTRPKSPQQPAQPQQPQNGQVTPPQLTPETSLQMLDNVVANLNVPRHIHVQYMTAIAVIAKALNIKGNKPK